MSNTKITLNCTHQLLNNLFNQFTERVIRMFTVQMIDKLSNDFSVCIGFECMSFCFKIILHVFVVRDDAIVNNNERALVIRSLWMRVYFARYTVRGPSCVRNSNVCIQFKRCFRFALFTYYVTKA